VYCKKGSRYSKLRGGGGAILGKGMKPRGEHTRRMRRQSGALDGHSNSRSGAAGSLLLVSPPDPPSN
jgi:hypothetical protein